MPVLVTGGAGFVGSHLVDRLLVDGAIVTVADNGSTGRFSFLPEHENLTTKVGDLQNVDFLDQIMAGQELVFHFAANADIRHGKEHPGLDVVQGAVITQLLLESMRRNHVTSIVYASSGAVYGNPVLKDGLSIDERAPFPKQTSFYGASKLACEALISAYCEAFGFYGSVFRFTPMLGERYSHGHIFDWVKKLQHDPDSLELLGNGQTKKYCVYVGDAINAIMLVVAQGFPGFTTFNIGNDQSYTIDEAANWVARELGLHPEFYYTGNRWAGDNPDMRLDFSRLKAIGWTPTMSLRESVKRTVRYLVDNPILLSRIS